MPRVGRYHARYKSVHTQRPEMAVNRVKSLIRLPFEV